MILYLHEHQCMDKFSNLHYGALISAKSTKMLKIAKFYIREIFCRKVRLLATIDRKNYT